MRTISINDPSWDYIGFQNDLRIMGTAWAEGLEDGRHAAGADLAAGREFDNTGWMRYSEECFPPDYWRLRVTVYNAAFSVGYSETWRKAEARD